jgi:hypothetical protein
VVQRLARYPCNVAGADCDEGRRGTSKDDRACLLGCIVSGFQNRPFYDDKLTSTDSKQHDMALYMPQAHIVAVACHQSFLLREYTGRR